jgi:hypothetical protein
LDLSRHHRRLRNGNGIILSTLGYTDRDRIGAGDCAQGRDHLLDGHRCFCFDLARRAECLGELASSQSALQKLADSLVLSNIAHRPARTAVSIAGIALGVLLVVFTVAWHTASARTRTTRSQHWRGDSAAPAGTIGLSGAQSFTIPVTHAQK